MYSFMSCWSLTKLSYTEEEKANIWNNIIHMELQ